MEEGQKNEEGAANEKRLKVPNMGPLEMGKWIGGDHTHFMVKQK